MKQIVRNIVGCKLIAAASFVVAFHSAAELAMAQKPGVVPNEEVGMTRWLVAAGVVVVASLAAFINPKRSHLN